jgi:hypothetical protein
MFILFIVSCVSIVYIGAEKLNSNTEPFLLGQTSCNSYLTVEGCEAQANVYYF